GIVASSFDLLAVLDTTSVRLQVEGYTSATVSFTLKQKVHDPETGVASYGEPLDLSTYITSIKIGSTTLSAAQLQAGTIELPLSVLEDDGAYITFPVITMTVKTGSAFEASNLLYSNYQVTVSVSLFNEDDPIISSYASNFVIYTNAKVVPDFIVR
ncbi:MAG: hypothetical protein J6W25_04455, partial [Bacilli bacterium]|nr:hypothetical protein [Bacilli bacterium]